MSLKKQKIISIFIAFGLCFPLHFLYDKFPSFFTSIFSPVNESIWEHMKLLFGSIIITGIIQKIYLIVKKEEIKNICFSNFIGAIISIPIYLIIFLPLYYIIGESMVLAISVMLVSIIIAEYISYKLTFVKDFKLEKLTILFVIITYIIFTLLSYYPIKNDLFIDKKTSSYGISKK